MLTGAEFFNLAMEATVMFEFTVEYLVFEPDVMFVSFLGNIYQFRKDSIHISGTPLNTSGL